METNTSNLTVTEKMMNLIKELNTASDAYYNGKDEILSNYEWDAKFDELARLEQESGIVLPDSPTQKVGSDNVIGEKESHEYPALSLDKTKSIDDLVKWANGKSVWMSWKEDGLTLVLTYRDGKLVKILTRGNGTIGTNITYLKDVIHDIPQTISYKGDMTVRGEALISYDDFYRINDEIEDEEDKYKNPRNLVSGTLSLHDAKEVERRNVHLKAFSLVHIDDKTVEGRNMSSWGERMGLLTAFGFDVVEHSFCMRQEDIGNNVEAFTNMVSEYIYPVDGLVICYEDYDYSQTGSITGHHATRGGYAFKWEDECVETILRSIEWQVGRTGVISPVGHYDAVELCGTTVTKASLHNVSYILDKDIRVGDTISVYKANMIIPCIEKSITAESRKPDKDESMIGILNSHSVPDLCPVCGAVTEVTDGDSMVCKCTNPACTAKKERKFIYFASRDCMNIMGLGTSTIKELINNHYLSDFADFYRMANEYAISGDVSNDKGELLSKREGWGAASVKKMVNGINASRKTDFVRFVAAFGIPNVGHGQAKLIKRALIENDASVLGVSFTQQTNLLERLLLVICTDTNSGFLNVDGIGPVIEKSLEDWGRSLDISETGEFMRLLNELEITDIIVPESGADGTESSQPLAGMTFVITGDVHIFKNRKELSDKIEELGGKATGSVTGKTTYLINNDTASTSSKNKKAKELNIPIISEEDFCRMAGI